MRRFWWLPALALCACEATDITPSGDTGVAIDGGVDRFVPPPDPDMGPGGVLGDPCESASDCESGFCVPNPDGGGNCSIACVEGEANACPDGWYCENSVEFGQPICRPAARLPICSPCTDDRQCGGPRDLCLPLLGQPGNSACARDCSVRECPAGFTCQQFGGDRQCIPDDGLCEMPPPDDDRDGDGVPDDDDACPDEYGTGPDGCPIPDRDDDGVPDDEDACPDVAGAGPDGCPVEGDLDNDGVPDGDDACPQQAGGLPNGCPVGSLNGQFISGGGIIEAFGRGIQGLLGAQPSNTPMSSPGYRIRPISFGVNP